MGTDLTKYVKLSRWSISRIAGGFYNCIHIAIVRVVEKLMREYCWGRRNSSIKWLPSDTLISGTKDNVRVQGVGIMGIVQVPCTIFS